MRAKSRLQNRVTTVHLIQCKTNFFIYAFFIHFFVYAFEGEIYANWEPSINIKNFVLICLHSSAFVYTRLHSSRLVYNRLDSPCDPFTLVYIRLDSSSDSSTLVCIRLVTRLYSSTFVYTRLDSSSDLSSDSSVFLEQIYV